VSAAGVAHALDDLYQDPRLRQQLAQEAITAARNPQYSWDTVAEQFDAMFVTLAQ
jgi:glycosyltransferase involved in cell wall biosynthesis